MYSEARGAEVQPAQVQRWGPTTTVVCRAGHKAERVTVHVFFRSCRLCLFCFCTAVFYVSLIFSGLVLVWR